MTVVHDFGTDHAAGIVAVKRDHDLMSIGVQAVPHELDDRLDRIVLVREPLDEVVASLKLYARHGHILPATTDRWGALRYSLFMLGARSTR